MHGFHLYVTSDHEDASWYAEMMERVLRGRADYQRLSPAEADGAVKGLGRLVFGGRHYLQYLLARLDPRVCRLFVKDPIASLASRWLTETCHFITAVTVRHPRRSSGVGFGAATIST